MLLSIMSLLTLFFISSPCIFVETQFIGSLVSLVFVVIQIFHNLFTWQNSYSLVDIFLGIAVAFTYE